MQISIYHRNGDVLFSHDEANNSLRKVLHEARISKTSLAGADLKGRSLNNLNLQDMDFRGADFSGSDLHQTNFVSADCTEADFSGADMTDVSGSCVKYNHCKFVGADLDGGNFRQGDFSGSDFTNAIVRGCDFEHAIFSKALMAFDSISGATFRKADLRESVLDDIDIYFARTLEDSRMDDIILSSDTSYSVGKSPFETEHATFKRKTRNIGFDGKVFNADGVFFLKTNESTVKMWLHRASGSNSKFTLDIPIPQLLDFYDALNRNAKQFRFVKFLYHNKGTVEIRRSTIKDKNEEVSMQIDVNAIPQIMDSIGKFLLRIAA